MGFYDTKSKQNKPVSAVPVINGNSPSIIPKKEQPIVKPDEMLTQKQYVINTQNNATAVNKSRLPTVIAMLHGFAEGSTVKVTYYKENYAETDTKGKLDNNEFAVDKAHRSTLKIHGMELRLTGPLSYEYDNSEVISKLTGEALMYPGLRPEKGDTFVMEVDTGKYALMQVVEAPQRTSIRALTYYKINFALQYWMSNTEFEKVEEGVVDEAWFDKTRCLAEPGALLYHDEYVEMVFLKAQRSKMINYFKSKFLDEVVMYSYMRPDSIYDPYVADFMHAALDFTESGHLATQLYENAPHLRDSVWRAILDENVSLYSVPTSSGTEKYVLGSKSVLANSLINRNYLFWKDSTSLQEYFDDLDEYESKFVAQTYPSDFVVTNREYYLTTDTMFKPWKSYYSRSTTTPYVYTEIPVVIGEVVPANTYNCKLTYGWKTGVTYYKRVNGAFVRVDTTVVTTPDPNTRYYVYTGSTSSSGTSTDAAEGELPADPTRPALVGGTDDEERTLGDVLLHLHPHYTECLINQSESTGGTAAGTGLSYVLDGSNDHIDLMRIFLKKRAIDLKKLHICIDNVWKLPPMEQFYKMPIYIFLARKGLAYIQHDAGIFD